MIETQYTFNGSVLKIVDPATGKFRISLTSNIPINNIFTVVSTDDIKASTSDYSTISDNALITGYLSVEGNVDFGNNLFVKTSQQGGGNIQIIPDVDGNESSIGFYNHSDARAVIAGDVWVCGVNSWGLSGYSIGTAVIGNCLNINSSGRVGISNGIQTPEIMINTVKALTADYLTIDDSAVVTGNLAVSSFVNIGDRLTVRADGYNGTIRCIPLVDTSESSLTFYNYEDMRVTVADDVWLMGQNYWSNGGYSIGTPGLSMCLNISVIGSVKAP